MKSVVRTAVIAGAIVSVTGLAAPGASAAQTESIETTANWKYCQHKKPEICGRQWTKSGARPGRVFQGFAVNKTPSTIKGKMGAHFKNPRTGKGYTIWNPNNITLKPARATVSGSYECKKGYIARGVWDSKPGQRGGESYSKPATCKAA